MTKSRGIGRHPPSRLTHGHTIVNGRATPEYDAWHSMKKRCLAPGTPNYQRYGGRGITICAQWRDSFETFLADMGPRPSRQHSLDRINNDGNYEPENCRWGTIKEQQRNKASVTYVEFNGRRMSVAELSEITGVAHTKIKSRLRAGWTVERAVQ